MRLFVNLLYNFKKSDKLSDLLAVLQQVLEENHWEQQRILFDFQDISDAATESRTSHHKMLNAFPQMKPYWKSSYAEYCLHHLHPTVPPHSQSYISNFPGRRSGQPVFPAPDANIDFALIKDIFAKIPRPYSFYSALVVLDGIDWTGTCNLSPALDWISIYGKTEEEDWEAGYWPAGMDFDEICPFYQSNSVRIGKEWELNPEITVQIEVFPGQGLEQARQVEAAFVKYFGTPAKRYTRAVHSWEGWRDWPLNCGRHIWTGSRQRWCRSFSLSLGKHQRNISVIHARVSVRMMRRSDRLDRSVRMQQFRRVSEL